jgi:hypothetical protein
MTDEANIEDVASTANDFSEATSEEVQRAAFEESDTPTSLMAGVEDHGIGDADTVKGQARRAEEVHLEEMREDSDKVEGWDTPEVEDLEPLPTPSEAELGELCRVPETQFEELELVDNDTPALIGVLEEEGR